MGWSGVATIPSSVVVSAQIGLVSASPVHFSCTSDEDRQVLTRNIGQGPSTVQENVPAGSGY